MHSDFNKNFSRHSKDGRPLILVVDNDSDNLLLASCIIESLGMGYAVTDDSENCLALVRKLLPDIILLDVVMPKLNGLEIASLLKQDANLAYIPIIAVTGLSQAGDKEKLLKSGFDDYLSKPYLIEELEAKLSAFLKDPLV